MTLYTVRVSFYDTYTVESDSEIDARVEASLQARHSLDTSHATIIHVTTLNGPEPSWAPVMLPLQSFSRQTEPPLKGELLSPDHVVMLTTSSAPFLQSILQKLKPVPDPWHVLARMREAWGEPFMVDEDSKTRIPVSWTCLLDGLNGNERLEIHVGARLPVVVRVDEDYIIIAPRVED